MGTISITQERFEVVDFLHHFAYEPNALLYQKAPPDSLADVYIRPFKWRVWMAFVLSIPIVSLVLWAFCKLLSTSNLEALNRIGLPFLTGFIIRSRVGQGK